MSQKYFKKTSEKCSYHCSLVIELSMIDFRLMEQIVCQNSEGLLKFCFNCVNHSGSNSTFFFNNNTLYSFLYFTYFFSFSVIIGSPEFMELFRY